MLNKSELRSLLGQFESAYDTEKDFIPQVLDFVHREENFWLRETLEGHLTGSAWILSADRQNAMLLHHAKLDRWLQPGGHADAEDASFVQTALREAKEECGFQALQLLSPDIFDLDIHEIPARAQEPAHLHYDLRFLFSAIEGETLERNLLETKAIAWWPIRQLCQKNWPESIRRMALKSVNMERDRERF